MRIIASRYPRTEMANRGRLLEQVELFAFDADAEAWPSPDGVAQFFGRAADENRFGQEDCELGLDRIVSYHLPGQELATPVGLSMWNLRIAAGFVLQAPPAVRPVQRLRQPRRDDRAHADWPRDPVIGKFLSELDWPTLLAKRPGWVFNADNGELRCEEGRALTLTTARPQPHAEGRTGSIFCHPHGGCEDCAARAARLRSGRPLAPKHAELSVPGHVAERLHERLAVVRGKNDKVPARVIEPVTASPGPLEVADPLFLPARARQRFRAIFHAATLHAVVELPSPRRPRPMLVAADVADQQRRRKSSEENVARYALPEGARVRLKVEASPEVRELLGEAKSARVSVGGSR